MLHISPRPEQSGSGDDEGHLVPGVLQGFICGHAFRKSIQAMKVKFDVFDRLGLNEYRIVFVVMGGVLRQTLLVQRVAGACGRPGVLSIRVRVIGLTEFSR